MLIGTLKKENFKPLTNVIESILLNVETIKEESDESIIYRLKNGLFLKISIDNKYYKLIEFSLADDQGIVEYISFKKLTNSEFIVNHSYYSMNEGKFSINDCSYLFSKGTYMNNEGFHLHYDFDENTFKKYAGSKSIYIDSNASTCDLISEEPVVEFMALKEEQNPKIKQYRRYL